MFLKQVVLHGGLPFEVRIPNAATKKALQELERGGGESFGTSTKEAFRQAMAVRKKRRDEASPIGRCIPSRSQANQQAAVIASKISKPL